MGVGDYSAWFLALPPDQQWPQMLRDVVAWLLINSMLSERTQYKLLCEQNLASVWRKAACLVGLRRQIGGGLFATHPGGTAAKAALRLLTDLDRRPGHSKASRQADRRGCFTVPHYKPHLICSLGARQAAYRSLLDGWRSVGKGAGVPSSQAEHLQSNQ